MRFLAYATGWVHECSLLNATVDLSTISDEEIPRERAKQAREREAKFDNWIFVKTPEILSWAMGDLTCLISTPIPTFAEIVAKAKTATPSTLRGDIASIDVTLEKIQDAIKFMRAEFQPEKDPEIFRMEKWGRDEGFTVGSKMSTHGFRVEFSIEAFTKLQKEVREKIAILDEAILWYGKMKSIHEAELAQRGKDEPAEFKRISAELRRVVKEADNQKNVVTSAVKKCCASKFTDKASAQTFLNAKRRFHELCGEHHGLLKQLTAVNVSGRKLNDIRDFPLELTPRTIDERSDWQRIERLATL
jgi:hypothetical protein